MATRKTRPHHSSAPIIDLAKVKSLAGSTYYDRGRRYFQDGAVHSLTEYKGTIMAVVHGTTSYKVRLRAEGKSLSFSCNCPLGIDGDFCKHCVAAALAWTDAQKHGGVTMLDDLEGMVYGTPHEDLARLVIDLALKDEGLRNRVLAVAARRAGGTALMPHYRKMVEDATEIAYDGYDEYLDYGSMPEYSESIDDLIASLDDLLKEKTQAPAVMELALYAIERVEHALEHSDDDAGYLGSALSRLADLHLRACRIAKPDPIELATQLFQREMNDEWGTFMYMYTRYGPVLGSTGREHYRALAKREWNKVKPLGPNSTRGYKSGRYRITNIMETIARGSRRLEELVDVLRKDLSSANNYLGIAEAYRNAKQYDLALHWAEEGLRLFPTRTDSQLLTFLVEEYRRRKMTEKMMAVAWQRFDSFRSIDSYKALLQLAPNAREKKTWRARALELLRTQATQQKQSKRGSYGPRFHAAPLLIEIHLMEKHDTDAWNTALEFGCDNELWLKLAAMRAERHPADALAVYRSQVDKRLPYAGDYDVTVGLLKKIRPLMIRLGRADEFTAWIAELRIMWKRRRNFTALLTKAFGREK